MPITDGTRLGPYEIVDLLGAGGMGEVWRARDTRLGREVAVKVLPDEFVDDPERAARFQREAQLLAAFNHPNIAGIYSFEQAAGIRLLVMELVPGETVKQILAKGPIPVPRALVIARDVADALDAAHAKGILHRDLKPANVKVTPEGKVKLLDFGLAKAFAGGVAAADISESPTLGIDTTKHGMVLGTASYMSPEQTRGRPLDRRSDVWAFGCLLYEMLTGKKAFTGDTVSDVLVAILDREPDWDALPPDAPRSVVELLKSCLTKRLDERLPDLAHARQQLDLVRMGRTTLIPAAGVSASRARRRPMPIAVGAAAVLLVVAAVVWIAFRERSSRALPATKLLAVLPAADFTGRPDGRALADGISMSLRQRLQPVPASRSRCLPAPRRRARPTRRRSRATRGRTSSSSRACSGAATGCGSRTRSGSTRLPSRSTRATWTAPSPTSSRSRTPSRRSSSRASSSASPGAGRRLARRSRRGRLKATYVTALGYLERYDDPDSVQKAIDLLSRDPRTAGPPPSSRRRSPARGSHSSSPAQTRSLRPKHAEDAASAAVRLDPALPEAQIALGRVLTRTGQPRRGDPGPLPARRKTALRRRGPLRARPGPGRVGRARRSREELPRGRSSSGPTSWYGWNSLGGFLFAKPTGTTRRPGLPEGSGAESRRRARPLRTSRPCSAASAATRRPWPSSGAPSRSAPSPQGFRTSASWVQIGRNFAAAAADFEQGDGARAEEPRGRRLPRRRPLPDSRQRGGRGRDAYTAALPLLEATLDAIPTMPDARVLLARCQLRLGKPEEARRSPRPRSRRLASNASVLYSAAAVAAIGGQPERALRLLGEARRLGMGTAQIEKDPDFDELRSRPGYAELTKPAPFRPPAPNPHEVNRIEMKA